MERLPEADMAEHWRYSSERDYLGRDGLSPVDKGWWTT
jgi:hypothetical protein